MYILKKLRKQITAAYRKKLLKNTDAILIISSGRTGTKFFERFFTEIDHSAIVFHEPNPDFFTLGLKRIRLQQPPHSVVEEIILRRGKLIDVEKKRRDLKRSVYVESNPFLVPILEEFCSVFKSIKMIYITRDPKTYLISAFNKDPQNDKINNFYADSDKRKRLTAVDFKEISHSEWNQYSREEKIAWYWNKSNDILFSHYLKNKENSVIIRYEDLFSVSTEIKKKTLHKIVNLTYPTFNFQGNIDRLIKLLDIRLNSSRQLSDKRNFEEFDERTKKKIENIIAPMSQKLGY